MSAIEQETGAFEVSSPLLRRCVGVNVKIKGFGNRKRAGLENVTTETDKQMLHMFKNLVASPELSRIEKYDRSITAWIESRAIPGARVYRGGIYLIPGDDLTPVFNKFELEFSPERRALVELFIEALPGLKIDAQLRLKADYDPNDYPTDNEIRARFELVWETVALGVEQRLRDISNEIADQEERKAKERWDKMATDVGMAMRGGLKGLVDHLVTRLEDKETGGRKRLYATTITNLTDFLETFGRRNVLGDDELQDLATRAQSLIEGVDIEQVKNNDELRSKIREGFQEIQTNLGPLVDRRITFEEE